ncbi:SAV_2336 N-terminal domain-related protein, partial [Streptomyces sp. NPDC059637]
MSASAPDAATASASPLSPPSQEEKEEGVRISATPLHAAAAPDAAGAQNGPERSALAVRVPQEKALEAGELRLGRALRPLKQRLPDARKLELDEARTVAAMAETGLPDVVLRPARTRWLDLALVVDDGISMLLWQRLATEVRALLERAGAFRSIRIYGLDSRSPQAPMLHLRPYTSGGTPLPPATVSDPSGRTLILVVSDGVGAAWRNGRMRAAVQAWARLGPTAIVHALPSRLWQGSGIRTEQWQVTARQRGGPNTAWQVADPVLPPELARFKDVPVPVLAPQPVSLGAWARLAASPGSTALLPLLADAKAPPSRPYAATRQPDVREALLRFRDSASPEAYRLAAHLAAVAPVSVPVMRLVQAALGPPTDTGHLAEVFLGGLMQRTYPAGPDWPDRYRSFDFSDETRRILMGTVPAPELLRASRAVAAQLGRLAGRSPDFPAWLSHPQGTDQMVGDGSPFGWLDDRLMTRLGVPPALPRSGAHTNPAAGQQESPGDSSAPSSDRIPAESGTTTGPISATPGQTYRPGRSMKWPIQVGVVPHEADYFHPHDVIDRLHSTEAEGGTAATCRVLVGMAGTGKTQLAAHHARRSVHNGDVDLLVWITASSREAIQTGYTQAAAQLLGADPANPEQAASWFLAWLENPGERRWLVVLDDLDQPADLAGLWPPQHPQGQTIITTRHRSPILHGPGHVLIDVGVFTPAEASRYLSEKLAAAGRTDHPEQITALAEQLGRLPLALALAATHIVEEEISCATYRARLTNHPSVTKAAEAPTEHDHFRLSRESISVPPQSPSQASPLNALKERYDLARQRDEAGAPAGTAAILEDLLTDQLRLLGPDHPDTLTTRN